MRSPGPGISQELASNNNRSMDNTIKIFNTPWHVAHQYELYKIPNTEWFHVVNSVRKWGTNKKFRTRPENVHDVPYYESGKYDLAVLHIDQQCVDPTLGKSRLYRELNEAIKDIPKIVINHGTPFWPEAFDEEYIRTQMKLLIGDNYMVVNSHRAKEMWGPMGKNGDVTTIIHGLDPEEWFSLPKEPRVVTSVSPAGLDKYYNRRLLIEVKEKLKERGIPHAWITVDWVAEDFNDYRNFLGRSLIYFNPTLESPMPRSRTEAMLSGCCVVTLPNQDAETFIKHGENGFHVPNNPTVIADLIEALLENYKYTEMIGQRGRQTAMEIFHKDRFQVDWKNLLQKVMEENKK